MARYYKRQERKEASNLETKIHGITFQGILDHPAFTQGLDFSFSNKDEIVLSAKITVTGNVTLSGGKKDVDEWVVGFVQNVTGGRVQAYYGTPDNGFKATREFPIEVLPCPWRTGE